MAGCAKLSDETSIILSLPMLCQLNDYSNNLAEILTTEDTETAEKTEGWETRLKSDELTESLDWSAIVLYQTLCPPCPLW